MRTVFVVGSINVDIVATAARHPEVGETIRGQSLAQLPGGKGANQAVASARLGADTALVGAVGNDASGRLLLGFLADNRVSTERIVTLDDVATGTALVVVAEADNMIVVVAGANGMLRPETTEFLSSAEAPVVLAQFETPIDTTLAAFHRAKEQRGTTILNPAPFASIPDDLVGLTDYLVLNESELEAAGAGGTAPLDEQGRSRAARSLLSRGARHVVLTLGARGAQVYGHDSTHSLSGHEVNAVDSTGAGDCFCGALAAAIARGVDDALEAVRFANAAAAISVQRAGAGPSMPTMREVADLVDEPSQGG